MGARTQLRMSFCSEYDPQATIRVIRLLSINLVYLGKKHLLLARPRVGGSQEDSPPRCNISFPEVYQWNGLSRRLCNIISWMNNTQREPVLYRDGRRFIKRYNSSLLVGWSEHDNLSRSDNPDLPPLIRSVPVLAVFGALQPFFWEKFGAPPGAPEIGASNY